jgi:hypothetical protein
MVLALEGTHPDLHKELMQKDDHFTSMVKGPRPASGLANPKLVSEDLHQKITDLLAHLGLEVTTLTQERAPTLNGEERVLEHVMQVGMPLGRARQLLDPFLFELDGTIVSQNDFGCEVHLPLPATFWQRLRHQVPKIEVKVKLSRVNALSATPIEVRCDISTTNVEAAKSLEVLEQRGPAILESLRKQLLVGADKRTQDRRLWSHQIQIIPVYGDGELGDPIECRGKDISISGMGVYLPHELDTSEVLLEVPSDLHPPTLSIPATLVRARRCADGWYDVGALFHLPALKKSLPGICVG